jgi:excisionase family DNA binding protein
MEKLLLTPEEAAARLSVGRSRIFELIGSGKLRSVRLGASRRIPISALVEFVDGLTADPNPGQRSAGGKTITVVKV